MNIFIKQISLKDDIKPQAFDCYPLNILALYSFVSLSLIKPVTIFNGENGCGKSTIIEALAESFDISITGGNRNLSVSLCEEKEKRSQLSKYLWIDKGIKRPYRVFFFRAESFYELASVLDKNDDVIKSNYSSKELLKQSHGQSFMDLIQHQFKENSLYLMDEPEAALSPSNQIKLIKLINEFACKGCQFIIASHSPLILGCSDASIINMDKGMKNINFKETSAYKIYKEYLDLPDKFQNDDVDI